MDSYRPSDWQVTLEPLGADNWELAAGLLQTGDLTRRSLLYSMDFNLTFNVQGLKRMVMESGTGQTNVLYLVRDAEGAIHGLIGITDIDWVQRRGVLLLLMGAAALKEKRSYRPMKILLERAFREWDLRRLVIPVFQTETQTATVLKGFGFELEGVLREHVFHQGEVFDIGIYGVLKGEFRHVEV